MELNGLGIHGFDWDNHNRDKILSKHGISPGQVESVFNQHFRWWQDRAHSAYEPRFIAVGLDLDGRMLMVVLTLRTLDGQDLIRPVSARRMHAKEWERYEKNIG
jgi:uncharacterized DUF497 family protein